MPTNGGGNFTVGIDKQGRYVLGHGQTFYVKVKITPEDKDKAEITWYQVGTRLPSYKRERNPETPRWLQEYERIIEKILETMSSWK